MGKWAQYRKRGGGGQAAVAVAPFAAVLSADGDPDISWTYAHTNPAQWRIEQSADGVTGWTQADLTPGGNTDYHLASAGTYYRVIGVDGSNNPATLYSNVVLQA